MKLKHFEKKDACGFWLDTPDVTVWASGDSPADPGATVHATDGRILFDFSENAQFHCGLKGAVKIANVYRARR